MMVGHYCHDCPLVPGAPAFRRARSFFGTHSYIVHRRGLHKIFGYPRLMPVEKQIDAGQPPCLPAFSVGQGGAVSGGRSREACLWRGRFAQLAGALALKMWKRAFASIKLWQWHGSGVQYCG